MLKIYLVFWESEPQYAYKRYAYKKKCNSYYIFPFQWLISAQPRSFTVNCIVESAFSDSLMASAGLESPPKISGIFTRC